VAKLRGWLIRITASERGQDMVEYAMLTMFISVAIVMTTMGLLSPAFGAWAEQLAATIPGGGA
jgi:Flp pilus assembly pilin Flp